MRKKQFACLFLAILLAFSVSSGLAEKAKPIKAESIEILAPETAYGGGEIALAVHITPDDAADQRIVWSLSPKSAGKISADGVLTLKKAKEQTQVTITAKSKDKGASAEYTLIVNPKLNVILALEEFLVKYDETTKGTSTEGAITHGKIRTVNGEENDTMRVQINEYCGVIFTVLPGTTDIIKITMEGTSNKPQVANMSQLVTVGDLVYAIGAIEKKDKAAALSQKIGLMTNKKSGTKDVNGLDYTWSRDDESGLSLTITKP